MNRIERLIGIVLAAALPACAAAPAMVTSHPVPVPQAVPAPPTAFVASSGMVIGTMSYNYVDVADRDWVVHLQRIDSGGGDYALPVAVDDSRHRGVFSGTLPAGVYAFREAATAGHHFPATAVKMPFEVEAGTVRDAGHYALNPVSLAQ